MRDANQCRRDGCERKSEEIWLCETHDRQRKQMQFMLSVAVTFGLFVWFGLLAGVF